jgi:hypothetical protein
MNITKEVQELYEVFIEDNSVDTFQVFFEVLMKCYTQDELNIVLEVLTHFGDSEITYWRDEYNSLFGTNF